MALRVQLQQALHMTALVEYRDRLSLAQLESDSAAFEEELARAMNLVSASARAGGSTSDEGTKHSTSSASSSHVIRVFPPRPLQRRLVALKGTTGGDQVPSMVPFVSCPAAAEHGLRHALGSGVLRLSERHPDSTFWDALAVGPEAGHTDAVSGDGGRVDPSRHANAAMKATEK